MEFKDFVEKRAYPRFPVGIPCSCKGDDCGKEIITLTRDISCHGAGLVVNRNISSGTCIDVCLRMEDNGEIIVRKAVVIWIFKLDEETFRLGIRISEPQLKPIPLVLRTINFQRKY